MNKTTVWTVIVSAAILVALVFVVPGMLQTDTEPAQPEPQSEVQPRPDCPTGSVGRVELPCLGGQTQQLEAKPTVVNVWAWWCGPCRQELPLFDALAEAHPEWNVVGVHADTNAANGAAMLNELGIKIPSYQDDANQFAGTHGLPGVVPITVVISPEGELLQSFPAVFVSPEELDRAVSGALSR
ncbi:TlpA disulfide reductase family protein [Corynebacterium sp. H128]|uniref:TlpA family protein disulfide reductase n=1 Tax=unclassified Corynebacterium TaxID=2624378 RepID=UPI003095EF18